MSTSVVYITASNREEATTIARVIVEERLAACANILDAVTSVYWWDGAINEETEAVLIAKTRAELVERLIERVKTVHSYDCPCITSWPITQANEEYLEWIEKETNHH